MIHKLFNMTLEDIKKGYTFNVETNTFSCNLCGEQFDRDEVYKVDDRFLLAEKMIKLHLNEHHNILEELASMNKKYTGLTENQKELLKMFHQGMSDQDIAKKEGLAPSTVRHHKFTFREKAKQAKLYLAIYELAFRGAESASVAKNEELIDIHQGAKMLDDRYFITKDKEEKILSAMFSSLSPLKLKTFATKEKNKVVILRKICEQFEKNKRYTEKELNNIIKEIYVDYVTIRRYLIEYGFMERKRDCSEYWLL